MPIFKISGIKFKQRKLTLKLQRPFDFYFKFIATYNYMRSRYYFVLSRYTLNDHRQFE